MHFFHKLTIFWSAQKWCEDTFFHSLSPSPVNRPESGSYDLLRLRVWKITKGVYSRKPASLNRPIERYYFCLSIYQHRFFRQRERYTCVFVWLCMWLWMCLYQYMCVSIHICVCVCVLNDIQYTHLYMKWLGPSARPFSKIMDSNKPQLISSWLVYSCAGILMRAHESFLNTAIVFVCDSDQQWTGWISVSLPSSHPCHGRAANVLASRVEFIESLRMTLRYDLFFLFFLKPFLSCFQVNKPLTRLLICVKTTFSESFHFFSPCL